MEGDNFNNYSFLVVCFSIICGFKIFNLSIEGNDFWREFLVIYCWFSIRVLIYELVDVAFGSDIKMLRLLEILDLGLCIWNCMYFFLIWII